MYKGLKSETFLKLLLFIKPYSKLIKDYVRTIQWKSTERQYIDIAIKLEIKQGDC